VDKFYKNFYQFLDRDLNPFFNLNNNKIKKLKIKFPNYSIEDIKFRLVRDIFLTKNEYEKIMFKMLKEKNVDYKNLFKQLFFQKDDLKILDKLGHLVGLHSHKHPTSIEKLSYDEQKSEYEKCQSLISTILKKPKDQIQCMSHPCGSYNNDTIEILKELQIKLGFKQIMTIEPEKGMKKINNSSLEIARKNHCEIMTEMN